MQRSGTSWLFRTRPENCSIRWRGGGCGGGEMKHENELINATFTVCDNRKGFYTGTVVEKLTGVTVDYRVVCRRRPLGGILEGFGFAQDDSETDRLCAYSLSIKTSGNRSRRIVRTRLGRKPFAENRVVRYRCYCPVHSEGEGQ